MTQLTIFDFIINIQVGHHPLEPTYDVLETNRVDGIFRP